MKQSESTTPSVGAISVFVHVPGEEMKVAVLNPGETLRTALHSGGVEVGNEQVLLVGEPTTTIEEGPDEVIDDEHAPAELDGKLCDYSRGGKHVHVHCHSCRMIVATVRYGQHEKRRKFSPARTIARVRAWAIRKFHLQGDAASDKLVLEICNSDKQPRPEQHLGELVSEKDQCEICLELVQGVAPQG